MQLGKPDCLAYLYGIKKQLKTIKIKTVMNNLVDAFIQLQSRANKQIEAYGQTTDEIASELERVADMLTPEQTDELISRMSEIEY